MNVKKILVIQPLPGIGDTIWFLPHLHALAKRGEVTLLTKKNSQAPMVLQADPHVKHIMFLYRNPGMHDGVMGFWRLVKLLRQGQFEEAWILHSSPRYAYAAKMAGIPNVYSYGTGLSYVFNKYHVKLPPENLSLHPINRAKEFLTACGMPMGHKLQYELFVEPHAQKVVAEKFAHLPKPWLVLGIGGSEAIKKWPLARWATLANTLPHFKGHIFLLGGPAESPDAETICSLLSPETQANVSPVTDLPITQSMALAKMADLFIGNDTGMLNIAAAAGTKTYGLFNHDKVLRYTDNLIAIFPFAEKPGYMVQDISVQDVLDAVKVEISPLESHSQ